MMARLLGGEFPFTRVHATRSPADWSVLTDVFKAVASQTYFGKDCDGEQSALYESGDSLVFVSNYKTNFRLMVAAKTEAQAEAWLGAATDVLPPMPTCGDDGSIPIVFYSEHPMGGASAAYRDVPAGHWSAVEQNYPVELRAKLQKLMGLTEPDGSGNLMLFHGPPGTGKTRVIEALLRAWAPWCQAAVVVDADKLFNDATYMNEVLLSPPDGDRWRLLVVEDADEFMDVDAKARSGQALSRLLNVGDGLIGRGLRMLTLLTTNVPMEQLNPAVSRKGRCSVNLQFGNFSAEEAHEWLGSKGVPEGLFPGAEMSLAEMYDLVRRNDRVGELVSRFGAA